MIQRPTTTLSAALMGLLCGIGASCMERSEQPNNDHCAWNEGDDYCNAQTDGAAPFCQLSACNGDAEPKYGCVAELPTEECRSECGHEIVYDSAPCCSSFRATLSTTS